MDRDQAAPAMNANAEDAFAERWRDRLRGLRRAYHQVVGIPDYEAYLAHLAAHHPGEPALTRQEYCAQAIDRKYGKGGARCC